MFVKINNLIEKSGRVDYKGLDINLIVPGTQIYPTGENVAYFEYAGIAPISGDIESVTESDIIAAHEAEFNKPKLKTEVELLREENNTLREEVTNTQVALVDVYETLLSLTEGGN